VVRRLHLLDGLLIAYSHLDEIIAIVRDADRPKPVLMERLRLSDEQAEAILELRLRRLGKLEEAQLRSEQKTLTAERERLDKTLASPRRLQSLLRKELAQDAEHYGDARRSPLVERRPAQALAETVLVPSEPVTVVLSEKGWVRAAKGHDIDPTPQLKPMASWPQCVGRYTTRGLYRHDGAYLCSASPYPALGTWPGRTVDWTVQPAGRRIVRSSADR
jgi:topoisomerase-4 subunit A